MKFYAEERTLKKERSYVSRSFFITSYTIVYNNVKAILHEDTGAAEGSLLARG